MSLLTIVRSGYQVERIESSFVAGNPYMGVHAVSDGKVGFEIQYHTAESLAGKHQAHALYEEVRDPCLALEARKQAFDVMRSIFATVDIPEGIDTIEIGGVSVTHKIYRRPGGA